MLPLKSLTIKAVAHLVTLSVLLLAACSSEKRDRLWQIMDPAGYRHSHSESFNGSRALPMPLSTPSETSDQQQYRIDQ